MSKEEMRLEKYSRVFAEQDLARVEGKASAADRNSFLAYCVYHATRKYGRRKGPDFGGRCALITRFARRNKARLLEAGLLSEEGPAMRLDAELLDVLLDAFEERPGQAPDLLLSCEGCDYDYDRVIEAYQSRKRK